MPPTDRPRIDHMPGKAGLQALEELRELRPDLNRPSLIDYALITALSALRYAQQQQPWVPPVLFGRNRDVWRVPAACSSSNGGPKTQS